MQPKIKSAAHIGLIETEIYFITNKLFNKQKNN